jgi:hypothetical protein
LDGQRCGEPFGGDGGSAMIATGVFAPGALEQIPDHALVGRRREPRFPMKEPDRRRPRAEGLG